MTTDEINTFQLKIFIWHANFWLHRLRRFVGVGLCVPYSRDKLALRTMLRILNLKSQFSILYSFRDICVHISDLLKFVGGLWTLKWAWKTFLLGQSIGIDENNKFQLKF